MYGQFLWEMRETVNKVKIWERLGKSYLKAETKALIFTTQAQALKNYINFNTDKTVTVLLYRLCCKKGEIINHIIRKCKMLEEKVYKRKHENIAR